MLFNIRRIKMEIGKKWALFTTITAVLFLIACHMESPAGLDDETPSAKLLYIYNSMSEDTILFNGPDSTASYIDFSGTIVAGDHYFIAEISDNDGIYEASLTAKDSAGNVYTITTVKKPESGKISFKAEHTDFKAYQEGPVKKFRIGIEVRDNSENVFNSQEFGYRVMKSLPFDVMFNKLGIKSKVVTRYSWDKSDTLDFRGRNGKLAFIQFSSPG
jgi:hypothetical protein